MIRGYSIEAIEEPSALEGLRSAWQELERADPVSVPGTFDFVQSWATTRLCDELHVVTIRRGGELVGLAPFVQAERSLGPVKVKVLHYITKNGFVPGVRALLRPMGADSSAAALVDYLTRAEQSWSFVLVNNLRPECALYRALVAKGEETGRPPRFGATEHSVTIELPRTHEEARAQWNENRRRTMGKRYERLRTKHAAEFEEIRAPADVERGLAEAFHVAERSWQGRNGTSIASSPSSREFYRRVCTVFAERDRLSLAILRADGQPVSFHLALVGRGTLYSLKWGYDTEWRTFGVGIISIGESIRAAQERGLKRVEFFHPASEAKLAWGAQAREHISLGVSTDAVSARLIRALDSLRRLGS